MPTALILGATSDMAIAIARKFASHQYNIQLAARNTEGLQALQSDPVISGALTLGVYERGEIAFFRSRFRAGMTLVDVGANVGLYSALALSTPVTKRSIAR